MKEDFMKNNYSVRVDEKGRISIPAGVRKELGLKTGDILFIRSEEKIMHLVKAENPFDVLAEHAVEDYKKGRTRNIRDIMKKRDR
jgi:AbrB family looped-hinge helix DNA binding protein